MLLLDILFIRSLKLDDNNLEPNNNNQNSSAIILVLETIQSPAIIILDHYINESCN